MCYERGSDSDANSWGKWVRFQCNSTIYGRLRDLALFNLAIDSKLRGCDLVRLRELDVCHGSHVAHRASVIQQKTRQPVQFELTEGPRQSISTWMASAGLRSTDFLFPSRIGGSPHIFDQAVCAHRPLVDR